MKIAVYCTTLVFITLLPLIVFAEQAVPKTVPIPKPAPASRPSPCDIAKKNALGKYFSTETIKGDIKTAAKDSCVGAVFAGKEKESYMQRSDINNYKCTGERARVNLSKNGVLIVSQGDAKVPLNTCVTTICEEGKPCRTAKLTSGVRPYDFRMSEVPVTSDTPQESALKKLREQQKEAQKILDRLPPVREDPITGNLLVGENKNDEILRTNAEQSKKTATEEIEKLLANPLPSTDERIKKERQEALNNMDPWADLRKNKTDMLDPVPPTKREVQDVTYEVVKKAYPQSYVQKLEDGEVTVVHTIAVEPGSDTFTPAFRETNKIFYDSEGNRFMEVNPTTGDVNLYKNGQVVQMRDEFGNISPDRLKPVLDTPAKFNTFWNQNLGPDAEEVPLTYKAISNPDGAVMHVEAVTGAGLEKTIPYPDYATLQNLGCEVHGTCAAMKRISEWTGGKYQIVNPAALAEPGAVSWTTSKNWPLSDVTPTSPKELAGTVDKWEKIITTFPPSLYENPNVPSSAAIYTFKLTPEAANSRFYGFGNSENGNVWMDANRLSSNEQWGMRMSYHELGHGLNPVFPSETEWAKNVYGDNYGRAYVGTHGTQVFKNVPEFPLGFAHNYGYTGGIGEDKATVFDSMFTNYRAMQEVAKSDLTLAMKMQMVQDSFYRASNGVMDQVWWESRTPIVPNYTVPRGNLVQKLMRGLEARIQNK